MRNLSSCESNLGYNFFVEEEIKNIINQFHGDRTELLAILCAVQEKWRRIPQTALSIIAEELDIPRVHVEGTATFYHFLSTEHQGKYTVWINTSATAQMAGVKDVIQAFENELQISIGSTTADDQIGFKKTSCIGMADQEPAILINGTVFTRVTPQRVKELVAGMRSNLPVRELLRAPGEGKNASVEVQNHIRLKGPVFFSEYVPGSALKKAMEMGSLEVIEEVKKSSLRGRGGAGFPTGQKWASCRSADDEVRYVICNADEGEPGTFKDRVLLTELPELIFEGMTLGGFAVEAKEGILYLRGEYGYLREHLEKTLQQMRDRHWLGRRILGTRFSFDIRIKQGAGAYICGEESALIESAEGKRGQPRNRPPFPVTSGYLHRPTIVNNPETFGCAVKVISNGAAWFRGLGTPASSGVKLVSIAGDCMFPGIYEVEWGKSVREILELCGAENVLAVQVGGPSGVCLSEKQFDRRICFSDLATGGAITVFNKDRDLLSIVHNYMEFFKDESCGFCVPCRAGNPILIKILEKVMSGRGTVSDLEAIENFGKGVKTASRCGLGQTSPNPLLSTLENFKEVYLSRLHLDVDYCSEFDLGSATTEISQLIARQSGLKKSGLN